MREEGTIVGLTDGLARVAMTDPQTCIRCGACSRIGSQTVLEVPVEPDDTFNIGDHVLVDVPPGRSFRALALVYLVPLAGLLLGAGIGGFLTQTFWSNSSYPNIAPILLSVVGLAAGYWFASSWDRRHRIDLRQHMRIVQHL